MEFSPERFLEQFKNADVYTDDTDRLNELRQLVEKGLIKQEVYDNLLRVRANDKLPIDETRIATTASSSNNNVSFSQLLWALLTCSSSPPIEEEDASVDRNCLGHDYHTWEKPIIQGPLTFYDETAARPKFQRAFAVLYERSLVFFEEEEDDDSEDDTDESDEEESNNQAGGGLGMGDRVIARVNQARAKANDLLKGSISEASGVDTRTGGEVGAVTGTVQAAGEGTTLGGGQRKVLAKLEFNPQSFVGDSNLSVFQVAATTGFVVSNFEQTFHLGTDSSESRKFWMHTVAQVLRKVQKAAKFWDTPELMGKKLTTQEKKKAYEGRLEAYRKGSKDPELMRVGGSFMTKGIPKAMRLLPETPSGNSTTSRRPTGGSVSTTMSSSFGGVKDSPKAATRRPTRPVEEEEEVAQSESHQSNVDKQRSSVDKKRSSVDKKRVSIDKKRNSVDRKKKAKSEKRKKGRVRSTTTATVRVTVRKPAVGKGSDVFDEVSEYHTIVVNNNINNSNNKNNKHITPRHVRKVQNVEDAKVSMITDAGRTFSVRLDDVTAAKLAALEDDDDDLDNGSGSRGRIERHSGGKRTLEHAMVLRNPTKPSINTKSKRGHEHGRGGSKRGQHPKSSRSEGGRDAHHHHTRHHKRSHTEHKPHQHNKNQHQRSRTTDTSISHGSETQRSVNSHAKSKNISKKKRPMTGSPKAQRRSSTVFGRRVSKSVDHHSTHKRGGSSTRSRNTTKSARQHQSRRTHPHKSIRVDLHTLSSRRLDITRSGGNLNAEEEGYSKKIGIEIDKMLQVIARVGVYDSQFVDGIKTVKFGILSKEYRKVSDSALVGVLLQAKRKCMVEYEGDILFNGESDDVKITALTKAKDFVMV